MEGSYTRTLHCATAQSNSSVVEADGCEDFQSSLAHSLCLLAGSCQSCYLGLLRELAQLV